MSSRICSFSCTWSAWPRSSAAGWWCATSPAWCPRSCGVRGLQVLTGLLLVGIAEAGTDPVNHPKVGVKLVVALAVTALAEIANARQKRGGPTRRWSRQPVGWPWSTPRSRPSGSRLPALTSSRARWAGVSQPRADPARHASLVVVATLGRHHLGTHAEEADRPLVLEPAEQFEGRVTEQAGVVGGLRPCGCGRR